MQSSTVPTRDALGPSGVGQVRSAELERRHFALIGLGGVAVGVMIGAIPGMPSPSLRAAMGAAAMLMATLAGAAVFVLMQAESLGRPSVWGFALSAMIAACAILVVVGWGVLALWCPSAVHVSLLACAIALGSSAFTFDGARRIGVGSQ